MSVEECVEQVVEEKSGLGMILISAEIPQLHALSIFNDQQARQCFPILNT